MARPGQRQTGARRNAPRKPGRVRPDGDVLSVLARTVRELEAAVQGARVTPSVRTKFQAVALLCARSAPGSGPGGRQRGEACRAAQAPGRHRGDPGQDRRPGRRAAGPARRGRPPVRRGPIAPAGAAPGRRGRGAAGGGGAREPADARRGGAPGRPAVRDLPPAGEPVPCARLLGRRARPCPSGAWPAGSCSARCSSSFERAGGGAAACMALPAPTDRLHPRGLELMPHQAQVVAAAAAGHRTFLLADEPGLGKTAEALLAAQARRCLSRCSWSSPTS